MKQTKFLLGACLALTLAGCSDEVGITADQLPVSGDEITFGAAAGQFTEPTKRTVYGFVDGEDYSNYKKLAIKWVSGQDQVRVYCPNESEQKWADYTVMAGETASGFYLQRTNENAQGVRWGNDLDAKHEFYSFYPLKTSNGASISGLQDNSTVRATIPTAQLSGEVTSNTDQGGGNNRTWYVVEPDMSYAMMVGTGTWTPGNPKNVTLNYKPIVTVLDIYVNGPDVNDAAEVNYTVTGVGVRSASQPIVGTFDYDAATDQCTYVTPESGEQDDNWAYVEVAGVDGNGQKLNPGEGMNVKFFLLPQDIDPSELTVYVFLSNGSVLSQPLSADQSEGSATLIAKGEIVKVLTPKVKPAETSNWMSAIGDDVLFASQLSLPGTKHSYSYLCYDENTGSWWTGPNDEHRTYDAETQMMQTYQTLDIPTQFDRGIRAFNVKIASENGQARIYVAGQSTDYTVDNLLDALKEKLDKVQTEAIVLTVDFVDNGVSRQDWVDNVARAIDSWSSSAGYANDDTKDGTTENNEEQDYFREITAETTMGAMRHGIGVVLFVPASVGNDNAPITIPSNNNVNVVDGYNTEVQNIEIWDATMGSGRGSASITIQNLEQNNNPTLSGDEGVGLLPYFITERYVREGKSLNLIQTKQNLVTELMRRSWQNNNGSTSADEKVRHLYMNDLSGFCVVNNEESTGSVEYATYTRGRANLVWNNNDWLGRSFTATDFRTLNWGNYTYVTFSRDNPSDPSDPSAGDTWLKINTEHSVTGKGGNNALLAQYMNPYAESEIRRFVNGGRTPLGIVFMSFAGTPTVDFGGTTYTVNGTTLPALIVANNFKFALATSKTAQQGN